MKGWSMNIALASDIAEHVNNCSLLFVLTLQLIRQRQGWRKIWGRQGVGGGGDMEEWDLSPRSTDCTGKN